MPFAPKTMHGDLRSATEQLTSPTNRLSLEIVRVLEMVPLMSVAWPVAAKTKSVKTNAVTLLSVVKRFIILSS